MSPTTDNNETTSVGMMVEDNALAPTQSKVPTQLGQSLKVFGVLPMSDWDLCRMTLRASFKSLSERAAALQNRTKEYSRVFGASIVVNACQFSLCSDFSSMLRESKTLLENMKPEDGAGLMIAPWRVSVSQLRAKSYLETIQRALDHPSRGVLDSEMRVILDSMSLRNSISAARNEEKHDEMDYLRISPWTMPILAFDVPVGDSVSHHVPVRDSDPTSLPMKVKVSAFVEILMADIITDTSTPQSAPLGQIQVRKCVHETHKYGTGAGIVGDACVHVRFSSSDEKSDETSKTWNAGHIPQKPMNVKEARCVQVNAFPPQPKASVDLFTSTVYGDSGIGISLCFETFQTLNNAVPEMNIELVVS